MAEDTSADITTLTVQLLSAFVSNNSVPSDSLADLIRTTRVALTADQAASPAEAQAATYTPAVSVRKSLSSPEHILSMIDGKPYKTLKRHLATHGLSPDEYRQRYNLPKSYPLVAPSYSEARRAVATRLGLGRKPTPGAAVKTAPAASESKAAAPAGAKPAPVAKPAPAAKPAAAAKPANAKTAAPKASKAAAKPAAKANGNKPATKANAEKPATKASADKSVAAKSAPAKKAKTTRSAKPQPTAAAAAEEKAS
ncbi:MAG TPA: MucR family transcriptional regulator [Rhizorhapis sp.]|nr:MucR family transcriptional regulator [Rhizorhapis sp.]